MTIVLAPILRKWQEPIHEPEGPWTPGTSASENSFSSGRNTDTVSEQRINAVVPLFRVGLTLAIYSCACTARVPQKYPPNRELGVWVNKQRREKRFYDQDGISSMTPIKIAKLEEAAFVWAKPKGVDAWEQRYEELQEFIAEHGHPHVPTRYPDNRALGRWVSTQRQMYKTFHSGAKYTKSLPPEEIERRISLLDSVRLSWCMMGRQEDFSSEETSLLQSAGIPYAPTSSVSVANNNKSQCDNANEDSIGLSSVAV
jgi:hypothetical protein